ncbi:unnamed protein product [Cladocopium goreaui]|uniref:Kinase D-interacting substrate of 220 kDa n=1 Tax=Cladocopium goreaui TaxID=2562237 RepID=A0A9P1BR94_9DINO|nr:unnamed protein product [Cladocopium goreaui]
MVTDERFPERVIFLDVDGVPSSASQVAQVLHAADATMDSGEDLFLRPCLERLALVASRGAAGIVLSSSWRLEPASVEEVRRQLATVKLSLWGATASDATLGPSTRAQEIVDWLQKAQEVTQRCVVLDDLDLGLGSCFVQVNGKEGLSDADVEAAVVTLNSRRGDVSAVLKSFSDAVCGAPWRERWEKLERKSAKKKKQKKEKKEDIW